MDRKTIIAYIVIILIFLLLPYYYKVISPQKEAPVKPAATTEKVVTDTTRQNPPVEAAPETASAVADTTLAATAEFASEPNPRLITVDTPLYHLEFSTRGGVLVSCLLKKYAGHDGGQVELIRSGSEDNLNLVLYRKGNPLDLKDVRFVPDRYEIDIPSGGSDSLILQGAGGGSLVQKVFTFQSDRYTLGLRMAARDIPDLDPTYSLVWGSGLKITEKDTAQENTFSEAYALMGGELEKFAGKEPLKSMEGSTEWVAQRRKYFEVALIPQSSNAAGVNFGVDVKAFQEKHRVKYFSMLLRMNGTLTRDPARFTIYLGPIDQKFLMEVDPRLEATMSWGWKFFQPLSKGVLWSLKALHKIFVNYGLVVIIFSILIKIVLWPLTQKSTKSMARMAAIQPKMKELQAKYKANPEKLNKAMMQLYKDEKVNPLGGCWPMALQMPVLFALFSVFRSTIEFRGAPFMLWIKDLSLPDVVATLPFSLPFYGSGFAILPLVMGASQLLSMKLTVTDPKQKFQVYFMPIFMTLFFNTLPSGLTLYYTLFNLLSYGQQVWIQKQNAAATAVTTG
jgi:YidC/Oxa1 family membrane protein insertase